MSLINDMLKDLEKRRSRDLETSETLSRNITWETRPDKRRPNLFQVVSIIIVIALLFVIAYLLWERNRPVVQQVTVVQQPAAKKTHKKKTVKTPKSVKARAVSKKVQRKPAPITEVVNDDAIDVEDMENDIVDRGEVKKISKKKRPLNSRQQAELAYQQGYRLLQQGRMHQGQEALRKALALYVPHIKAREVLAGSYIRSGRFVQAAELLKEGVKLHPEYSLFAKLYARVLLELNNPQLAIKVLKNGAADITQEPDYYALLAAIYQRVNAHNKAADIYLRLVKIRPQAGVWWIGLAISLEKTGKTDEARQAYERALETGTLKASVAKFAEKKIASLRP